MLTSAVVMIYRRQRLVSRTTHRKSYAYFGAYVAAASRYARRNERRRRNDEACERKRAARRFSVHKTTVEICARNCENARVAGEKRVPLADVKKEEKRQRQLN